MSIFEEYGAFKKQTNLRKMLIGLHMKFLNLICFAWNNYMHLIKI